MASNKFDSSWNEQLPASDYDTFIYQVQQELKKVETSLPVQVVSVSGTGTGPVGYVDVKPLVQQLTVSGQPVSQGIITNLPYCRIQGGANAFIVDPEVGDIGIAVFASRDISGVKNAKRESPPASRRTFSLNDGFYIGGILNKAPTQWVYINPDGEVHIKALKKIILDAPLIEFDGNMTQTAGKGNTATFRGGINNIGGDIVSNGISLEHHKHPGVSRGSSRTDEPV